MMKRIGLILLLSLFVSSAWGQIFSCEHMTDEQIAEGIRCGRVNFVRFGINTVVSEEYVDFKSRYGVGMVTRCCSVTPQLMDAAKMNNRRRVCLKTQTS